MDGHYKPGDKLPSEPELCRIFQVRRNALREALKSLSFVGLIREERGSGTFIRDRSEFLVRPLSLGLEEQFELQSLLEARQLMEVELAGIAADRSTPEEIQTISDWLDKMKDLGSTNRSVEYYEADIEFHFAIARAAHNPILARYLTLTRNLIHKWFNNYDLSFYPAGVHPALEEHSKILEAIRGGKSTEARQAMKRHLVSSANRLIGAMAIGKDDPRKNAPTGSQTETPRIKSQER
jgi:GntR family transcriptional repressor for pyruvate dehydrogenase complex